MTCSPPYGSLSTVDLTSTLGRGQEDRSIDWGSTGVYRDPLPLPRDRAGPALRRTRQHPLRRHRRGTLAATRGCGRRSGIYMLVESRYRLRRGLGSVLERTYACPDRRRRRGPLVRSLRDGGAGRALALPRSRSHGDNTLSRLWRSRIGNDARRRRHLDRSGYSRGVSTLPLRAMA